MDDSYPAVRLFAWRSLRNVVDANHDDARFATLMQKLPPFDFEAGAETRQKTIAAWKEWWQSVDKRGIAHPGDAVPLDEALQLRDDVVRELKAKQQNRAISIGE
jgi:hypothetical protein